MKNELLFQFIWQHSLYRPAGLCTADGEKIVVLYPGRRNTHAGPDFEEAKIRIGDTLLVGNVELHIKASDWYRHGHHYNKAYDNIILHVVWKNDVPVKGNNLVPLLEMAPHIPSHIISNYQVLIHALRTIPCAAHLDKVSTLNRQAWLTRLLAERWEMRFAEWDTQLKQNAGDWRVLLYWRLAANFGFKTNAVPFLLLAQSLPVNILGRHHQSLFQIEALLFGQAGMLNRDFRDEYPFRLRQEYDYLRRKYQLQALDAKIWKFMRMRPANFPTVRIAQFAALIHHSLHLFTQIVASSSFEELAQLFEVSASGYWEHHFRFEDEARNKAPKHLGAESIRNIVINTVAPIRYYYSQRSGLGDHCETSLQLLEQIAPEKNRLISEWEEAGWIPAHAAESQGMIQLFNQYCSHKRCLQCSIGHSVIRLRP